MAEMAVALHISPEDVWALTMHEVNALARAHRAHHRR